MRKCNVFEMTGLRITGIFTALVMAVLLLSVHIPVFAQSETLEPAYKIVLCGGEYNQYPHFGVSMSGSTLDARPVDLSGWDVGDSLSRVGIKRIRECIDSAYTTGFSTIFLRVDWSAIEPVENDIYKGDISKLTSILDEIDSLNMKSKDKNKLRAIISFELDKPPSWFVDEHPASEMVSLNPFQEVYGPMGPIKGSTVYSSKLEYGIFGEPDYQSAAKALINNVVMQLKSHPALFGWAITSPSSPMMYPGAGKDGIGGFSDYSRFTSTKFSDLYGIDEEYSPLKRESQGGPDLRPNWRSWSQFRINMRRESVDALGKEIFARDFNHPIFVLFWGVMAYEGDNGYRSEVWGNDYYYQLTQDYVNGVLIPFTLSSKTFQYPSGEDDMDSLHQMCSSIEMAQRHGKVPILMVEKSWKNPPSIYDIDNLAHLAVALGVDIIWSHNSLSNRSNSWDTQEKESIEKTSYLNLLPLPVRKQRARVAVLDYPFELSKYYSEKDQELSQALTILDAFQDSGFNYIVITPEEIIPLQAGDPLAPEPQLPSWIENIQFVTPLVGNLSEYFPDRVSDFLKKLEQMQKTPFIFTRENIDTFVYYKYDNESVRRRIQERFAQKGVRRHWLMGNKCFIVVNWPYIFVKVIKKESGEIKINLDQYNETGPLLNATGTLAFYDLVNDKNFKNVLKYNKGTNGLEFTIPKGRDDTFLLLWAPKAVDLTSPIVNRITTVEQIHKTNLMKRSLPIALVLTFVAVALGVIFTVQLYHPTVAKKRRKRRKPPPVLHDHENYFKEE
jgi:hypothetical protein